MLIKLAKKDPDDDSGLALIPMKMLKKLIAWYKDQQVGVGISIHLRDPLPPSQVSCLFIPR